MLTDYKLTIAPHCGGMVSIDQNFQILSQAADTVEIAECL